MSPKLPEFDLTNDANMLLIKRATVQFITWTCYTAVHNDIFLTAITMYDRLKFS